MDGNGALRQRVQAHQVRAAVQSLQNKNGDHPSMQSTQAVWDQPIADVAMTYGQPLAMQGFALLDQGIAKYFPLRKLRCCFAVDTDYVQRKLALLLFPYFHKSWETDHQNGRGTTPRTNINIPDLYIPTMALLTFILVEGWSLGIHSRFRPEALGSQAVVCLGWQALEMLTIYVALYITAPKTRLDIPELIAYTGYKYVGMSFNVLALLLLGKHGYRLMATWNICAIITFMVRTLRLRILVDVPGDAEAAGKHWRLRIYLVVAVAMSQPVFMIALESLPSV
uniref:protein YIF1B-A-like isoform X2 n=1 Tax=Myxine glutinosa TaxID=7769 RepID=UPI00358E9E08